MRKNGVSEKWSGVGKMNRLQPLCQSIGGVKFHNYARLLAIVPKKQVEKQR